MEAAGAVLVPYCVNFLVVLEQFVHCMLIVGQNFVETKSLRYIQCSIERNLCDGWMADLL